MAELERMLRSAAAEIAWPAAPEPVLPVEAGRPRRRGLVLVLVVLVLAFAVAMAVPGARSAILRALHLEGVSIVRVDLLPPAQARPLGAGLGAVVSPEQARQALST